MSARGAAFRQRLDKGETALGACLSITDPAVAELMAHAGLAYIMTDTEHTTCSLPALEAALITFPGVPTVPILRIVGSPCGDALGRARQPIQTSSATLAFSPYS